MNTLEIWTVFDKPSDYPDKFVVRKFNVDKPTDVIYTADSLKEVRKYLPEGLIRIRRMPDDVPAIVETWI